MDDHVLGLNKKLMSVTHTTAQLMESGVAGADGQNAAGLVMEDIKKEQELVEDPCLEATVALETIVRGKNVTYNRAKVVCHTAQWQMSMAR